jgi:hypothetical protein
MAAVLVAVLYAPLVLYVVAPILDDTGTVGFFVGLLLVPFFPAALALSYLLGRAWYRNRTEGQVYLIAFIAALAWPLLAFVVLNSMDGFAG